MKRLAAGILAHVDAGKTTLSEAMLYIGGSIRRLGRVDRGDAFLDTYELEKRRGITIFSKQAMIQWQDMQLTLLDTPGHVDFSAEMERTLSVLDYAILVISGSDGVQGHTRTLWRLLSRYQIPCFLFINKMDLAGVRREELLAELKKNLDEGCVDFGETERAVLQENIALCGEEALEAFLETGSVPTELIRDMIAGRTIYPCYFGSALKLDGIEEFMTGLLKYTASPVYPEVFGAKVFKITRDSRGNRLTYMKITGGSLNVKDIIGGEKVDQIRLYSGEKYEMAAAVQAGVVCAVTGLTKTAPGEGIGADKASPLPVLEPVLTCCLCLPEDVDAAAMLPKLSQLEEEEPGLHLVWEEHKREIHVQIMGEIQMEILKNLIAERFFAEVEFGERSIVYKETIRYPVEGVGHFEPLRHYAEVHLLLEPGEPGSGLQFDTDCSEDDLDRNWQRLVLTHLEEKEHKGVLTGSAITDMKITLVAGRAHKKHTEGGDFRQAVYRAVRQGLMEAESVLLEPVCEFQLEVPTRFIGRVMADVERMCGRLEPPVPEGETVVLAGTAPVACIDGYQKEVSAYTAGAGRLTIIFKGYAVCHNTDQVIDAMGYDPEADVEHTPSSVFCAHGAGFVVPWNEVKDYMHLESGVRLSDTEHGDQSGNQTGAQSRTGSRTGTQTGSRTEEVWIGTDEVDAILSKTFYANRREGGGTKKKWNGKKSRVYTPGASVHVSGTSPVVRDCKKEQSKEAYLLVDGYNIIFAWKELRELAQVHIDSARGKLLDILCGYQGIFQGHVMVVFDAYRVQGHDTECVDYHNIRVVYTKEAESADQYIEKFAHENGKRYQVTVATSDRLEQIIIRGQSCLLLSARELEEEIKRTGETLRREMEERKPGGKYYLLDGVTEETKRQMKELPEEGK